MSSDQTQHTRLLLVEDEAIVALSEKRTLEKHGYEIVTVYSGEQAVKTATEDTGISLVLMDIDLGSGIDGTEAAQQILKARSLPIVFLTSHVGKDYVDLVKKITSYGYVLKNSGEFVLIESIEMAFTLYRTNNELKRQGENLRTALVQQENTEQALQIHVQRYEQLFDNIDSCVAVYEPTDGATNFVFVEFNKAAENADRLRKADVIGKRVTKVFPRVKEFGMLDILKRVARTGTPEHLPVSHYSDGRIAGWRENYVYKLPSGEVVAVYDDVTERKQAEQALEEMYTRLQTVIDSVPFLINEIDVNGHYLLANQATCKLLGLSKEQLIGTHFSDVLPQETADVFQARVDEVYTTGEQLTVDDTLELGGKQQVFRSVLTPVLQEENEIQSVVGIAYDASQQLNALHQKDLLMRELNHRVKNNLRMVSSLIHLKEAALGGEVDLSDLKGQVSAIEEVHKSLQESDDITHISLKSYVADILSGIFKSSPSRNITIDSNVPDISVGTLTALPLGLIINETATNALKHGFSKNREHRFTVAMEQSSEAGEYILTISNSGRPFPDDVDLDNPHGLGLQLVTALVQQLEGTLELRRKPEPVFTIRFPVHTDTPPAGGGCD